MLDCICEAWMVNEKLIGYHVTFGPRKERDQIHHTLEVGFRLFVMVPTTSYELQLGRSSTLWKSLIKYIFLRI